MPELHGLKIKDASSYEFTNCFTVRVKPRQRISYERFTESGNKAHGDLERWHGVRAIDVVFNFSGDLLDLKGFPGHHLPPVSVDTLKPRVVLQRQHGDPDDRWIFTANRVWIERAGMRTTGPTNDLSLSAVSWSSESTQGYVGSFTR